MRQDDPGERGVDLLAAVRRHTAAFLLPIVLFAGVLGAYGLLRTPTFTAEARIAVGRLDVATQGLPGFAQAGSAIAAAYARAVDAPYVARRAGTAAGVSAREASDGLSASPIPDAPLIRIEAQRSTERSAVRLANGGAKALVRYSRRAATGDGSTEAMLVRYSRLARETRRLALVRDDLERRLGRNPGSDAVRRRLQNAEGKYRAALLQRDALANAYGSRATGTSSARLLEILAPATSASSDRAETLVRLLITGALAGLIVGLALAAWAAGRAPRPAAAAAATA